MADRWDDATGIPGYMGEPTGTGTRPDWRNNGQFDREDFTDADADGTYDPGESFFDGNANGVYDQEQYDPMTTGYRAEVDMGLEILLHPGAPTDAPTPGLYVSVALPPVNKGTPNTGSDAYRWAWASCEPTAVEPADTIRFLPGRMDGPTNQAMRDIIATDPDAYWDDALQQVAGSSFARSPRILFIPVHDPSIPLTIARNSAVVRKVAAFFAERMVGPAQVRGRLLRVQAEGETCGGGSAGGFIVLCPVPSNPASWGRVKATYR